MYEEDERFFMSSQPNSFNHENKQAALSIKKSKNQIYDKLIDAFTKKVEMAKYQKIVNSIKKKDSNLTASYDSLVVIMSYFKQYIKPQKVKCQEDLILFDKKIEILKNLNQKKVSDWCQRLNKFILQKWESNKASQIAFQKKYIDLKDKQIDLQKRQRQNEQNKSKHKQLQRIVELIGYNCGIRQEYLIFNDYPKIRQFESKIKQKINYWKNKQKVLQNINSQINEICLEYNFEHTKFFTNIKLLINDLKIKSKQNQEYIKQIKQDNQATNHLLNKQIRNRQKNPKLTVKNQTISRTQSQANTNLNQELTQLKIKIKKLEEQNKQITIKFEHRINQLMISNLFSNSSILQKQKLFYKQFLFKEIKQKMMIQVKKTELLYDYSKLPKSNFHVHIDQKPNILLLVKLKNGQIIGGFSKDQFKVKHNGKVGFIFNLTDLTSFQLMHKYATVYDQYYLIFGNSEIRIKSQENIVYSNFGLSNGYFNSNGKEVNSFLKQGNSKQAFLQNYQIYQLFE